MPTLHSLVGPREIPVGDDTYRTDEHDDVDVPAEIAGRAPSGIPGVDEDYDPGEGLLAQTDTWALAGSSRPQRPTVKAVLKAVGDDPEKAQSALDAELATDDPRSTLVDQLNTIIDGGQG